MTDGPYRTPGDNGDLPPGFYRCGKCRAAIHPLNNCRRIGEQFWCMPCYEKLVTPGPPPAE